LLFAEVPHLHSYDSDYPSILIIEPVAYARRIGVRSAIIFHDILPLTHHADGTSGQMFKDILPEGGSEAGEIERLRFTVYAQAMAIVDIVLPVSRTSGLILHNWLVQHGYSLDELPTISPILLPEEVYGIARGRYDFSDESSQGPIEFLTIGTLCAHKNQLTSVRAFSNLMLARPDLNLKLHVVGTVTPECAVPASLLAKRSAGRITLHGHLPDAELSKIWPRVRASVFVSLAEGYGLPVAESLWFGKPCICSGEGSIAEIAAAGGCLTVDPRNPEEIESAFFALATDANRYRALLQSIQKRPMRDWKGYAAAVVAALMDDVPEDDGDLSKPREHRPVSEDIPLVPWLTAAPIQSNPQQSSGDRDDAKLCTAAAPTTLQSAPVDGFVYARDDNNSPLTLPAVFPAQVMRVHDAYAVGARNRLRDSSSIRYDQHADGHVSEPVLFFGPYLSLEPGRYSVRFQGKLKGMLRIKITQDFTASILHETVLSDFSQPVFFTVAVPAQKVEFVGERTETLERMDYFAAELERDPSFCATDENRSAELATMKRERVQSESSWVQKLWLRIF
jgi:glycosyltransferase involved in cell wall biosynthesis